MLEWFVLILMAGLIASFGGILHIVVPPYDTDAWSIVRRYAASWLVGLVMGTVLPDPTQYPFPSWQVFGYVLALVPLGYVAIDVVKQWLANPPIPPTPVPPAKPPGT